MLRKKGWLEMEHFYKDKEWLYQQYCILKIKVSDIAKECNTTTDVIYDWIHKYDIPTNRYAKKPSKEILKKLYIDDLKSLREIAEILGASRPAVTRWIKDYDIPIRTISEANHNYMQYKGGTEKQSKKVTKDWLDDEYRKKQSEIKKEIFKNNPILKIQHSATMQGIPLTQWKGFAELETRRLRKSSDYKEWHSLVLKRDNYTCQCCGKKGGKLHVHHLESFSHNPELRFDISNGITLCEECHSPNIYGSFHNLYGTFNNTKQQFIEYLNLRQTYKKEI